jgi:hypothetical protein
MKCLVSCKPALVSVLLLLLATCQTVPAQMGPPPGTYEITSGEKSVTIPFTLKGTYVLFTAEIAGKEIGLVLDTGMPANGVFLHAGPDGYMYGLESVGQAGVKGASGDMVMSDIATGLQIDLPGLVLRDQSAIIMPYALDRHLVFTREGMPGVIGLSLFGQFVVEIDYDKKVVVLTEPDAYTAPEDAEVIPLTFNYRAVPQMSCSVQMSDGSWVQREVVIDCGHARALALTAGVHESIIVPVGAIETRIGIGATGPLMGHIGRIPALTVGSHTFENVVASFRAGGGDSALVGGKEGNLGAEILSRFRVTFDYENERMLLVPGDRLDEPFEHDMSGLEVSRIEDGTFVIDLVVPGSVAEEAGISAGDVIVEIMGRPAGDIGRTEFRELMKTAGEVVSLVVLSEGETRTVKLTLRRQV